MDKFELAIPPEALSDPDRFELLRLWAAHKQLDVTISGDLGGGAKDFGELLADLFEHASRMYAQRDKQSLEEVRDVILEDFNRRIADPNPSRKGSMPTEH